MTMNRRYFIGGMGGALAGSLLPGTVRAASRAAKPNILFIITDQQHADALGAVSDAHIRTPAMDALAGRGTRFEVAYSPNPVCSPARSCFFTGRTSCETGVYKNGRGVRKGMPNVGEWFSARSDYDCVYAGKWHVPSTHTLSIPGFRVLQTGIGGQGNLGDTATSRACAAFLRGRPRSRPFFMVASFLQPHDICEWLRLNSKKQDPLPYPWLHDDLPPLPDNFGFDPREPEAVRERRAGNEGIRNEWAPAQWRYYRWAYNRHVEMVDAEIGRVLEAVADAGYERETLVAFIADHGEGLGHHQTTRKNNLYNEAARVPLIVSLPGTLAEGAVNRTHVVSGLDLAATFCETAGLQPPPDQRGRSLVPLLRGNRDENREYCVSEVSSNSGRMLRTPQFKYIRYRDDPVEQLFDMQADPGELKNLAAESAHADTLVAHRRMLADWEGRLEPAPDVPEPAYWKSSS